MPVRRRRSADRPKQLSHVAANGSVRMVDVSEKSTTERQAIASASIRMAPATLRAIKQRTAKKGDVFAVAQIAGIQAAKKTAELIPLCHPVPLTHIEVECTPQGDRHVTIRCTTRCAARTGVEMEALTGAAVAALTVYDMCKAIDKNMRVEHLQLLEKSGGRSGVFKRGGSR